MDFKARLEKFFKKHGKKAVVIFLIYFVTKWTLTFIFGAKILQSVKHLVD